MLIDYELYSNCVYRISPYNIHMRNSILKIMAWCAVALIIPILGNQFVEGWNWQWNDFLFAWVFWVIMCTTIVLVTKKYSNHQILIGSIIFLAFASIWVMFATG
jgi:hypothetical protein